jgi:hypothetical protein
VGLFILSIIHFRERVIHVDSALQIFKWIQTSTVEVEAYRFSAIFPQLLVRLVKAAGAELKDLMLVASVMHVLVSWLIYTLVAHVFRSSWVAAATALGAVLCTRLTFYGIVLEANYLLSYPFLLAGILESIRQTERHRRKYFVACFSLALVLMVHPVGFLIALYVLAFFFITRPELKRPIIALAVIAVLWGLFSRILLPPSDYESDLYRATAEGLSTVSDLTKWPSLDFLIGHTWRFTTHYLLTWILLLLVLGLMVHRRAWVLFVLILTGTIGYIILNVITYHAGETAMMMEKNFLPLATLISLPLLYEIDIRSVRWWRWSLLPFVIVVFMQFRGISFASRPLKERYLKLEQLVIDVERSGISKAIVPNEEFEQRAIDPSWAIAFESILISSLNGPQRTVTVIREDAEFDDQMEDIYLIPHHGSLPASELNPRYFELPEQKYQIYNSPNSPPVQ